LGIPLLVFDMSYAVFRMAGGLRVRRRSQPPTYLMVIGFVLALALVTYAVRVVVPAGTWVPTAAGRALSGLDLPIATKVALAVVVVLPACFVLAAPIRRLPGVRKVL
jgi:hypothetical protein